MDFQCNKVSDCYYVIHEHSRNSHYFPRREKCTGFPFHTFNTYFSTDYIYLVELVAGIVGGVLISPWKVGDLFWCWRISMPPNSPPPSPALPPLDTGIRGSKFISLTSTARGACWRSCLGGVVWEKSKSCTSASGYTQFYIRPWFQHAQKLNVYRHNKGI